MGEHLISRWKKALVRLYQEKKGEKEQIEILKQKVNNLVEEINTILGKLIYASRSDEKLRWDIAQMEMEYIDLMGFPYENPDRLSGFSLRNQLENVIFLAQ